MDDRYQNKTLSGQFLRFKCGIWNSKQTIPSLEIWIWSLVTHVEFRLNTHHSAAESHTNSQATVVFGSCSRRVSLICAPYVGEGTCCAELCFCWSFASLGVACSDLNKFIMKPRGLGRSYIRFFVYFSLESGGILHGFPLKVRMHLCVFPTSSALFGLHFGRIPLWCMF